MSRRGILVVVSGFSGVGKGTLMKRLTEKYSQYALSVSATTRAPRKGEVDGREYFFRTKEEFEELIRNDMLIEHAEFCDNYYGTPREYVEDQMSQGRDVILEIETQGARQVCRQYPDALTLFIMPPDARTLLDRLKSRGSETEDKMESRLACAVREADCVEQYDYMIVNDDLEESVDQMHGLIESQHWLVSRNRDFAEQIRSELKVFAKGE